MKHDVLYLDFELGEKTFENDTQKILKNFFGDVANHPFLHIEHLNGQGSQFQKDWLFPVNNSFSHVPSPS